MKKTCLCCGYLTLEKGSIHEICPVCWWQDDPISWDDPDVVGGANGNVSLRQAQKNFIEYGACEKVMLDCVRKPIEEEKDPDWRTL